MLRNETDGDLIELEDEKKRPKTASERIMCAYPAFTYFYSDFYALDTKILVGVMFNKWNSDVIYRCIMRKIRKLGYVSSIEVKVVKKIAVKIHRDVLARLEEEY